MKKNILSDLFDENFSLLSLKSNPTHLRANICELENEYIFSIDVAGIKKENINISIEEGYLIVAINQIEELENNGNKKYIRRELLFNNMKRSFYVGDVKEENIKANLNYGLLVINVPKTNENIKKTINID